MASYNPLHFLSQKQKQTYVVSLGAFLASILLVALLFVLGIIVVKGSTYFWPSSLYEVTYKNTDESTTTLLAKVKKEANLDDAGSTGSNDYWWLSYSDSSTPYSGQIIVEGKDIVKVTKPKEGAEIRLVDGRILTGYPTQLQVGQYSQNRVQDFPKIVSRIEVINQKINDLREDKLAHVHAKLAELDKNKVANDVPARVRLNQEFTQWQSEIIELEQLRQQFRLQLTFSDHRQFYLPVNDIAQISYPNQLSLLDKIIYAGKQVGRFLSQSPQQANTAGGVFPALFGTVLMVFIMTIIVTPFGVLAAVYLNEYAPNTWFTSAIRISVSNMAGVPSIVYGVFGLGFFVYTLGGNIDSWFFADALPAPTMGAPGVFWASLTMALLTLPVVIVATEEGLRRVPIGLKAGSYALGATKIETIWRTVLPIASPGIMTGVILAIARAAGEVAPLMLVGAVKFAPNLPIDGEFPYLHLDRQFMHLGVLIYDGAFHSQTDAKGASIMFASCLLLLIVVFILNLLAVLLRARLRKRYLLGD
jgi:phosphate transport system permease protein